MYKYVGKIGKVGDGVETKREGKREREERQGKREQKV